MVERQGPPAVVLTADGADIMAVSSPRVTIPPVFAPKDDDTVIFGALLDVFGAGSPTLVRVDLGEATGFAVLEPSDDGRDMLRRLGAMEIPIDDGLDLLGLTELTKNLLRRAEHDWDPDPLAGVGLTTPIRELLRRVRIQLGVG